MTKTSFITSAITAVLAATGDAMALPKEFLAQLEQSGRGHTCATGMNRNKATQPNFAE